MTQPDINLKLAKFDRPDNEALCRIAAEALTVNAQAIAALPARIDAAFLRAVEIMLAAERRVVVTGIGKSGLIGRKISATLASLGTPSHFVHAADAVHGDLGMIVPGDVCLMISASGETEEVLALVPYLKSLGVPIIALTGNTGSTLNEHCDASIDASFDREACPHNLAPTTSTMVALALGDALAIALGAARGFNARDFARYHPGGRLGYRLRMKVSDLMHSSGLPTCAPETGLREMTVAMTSGGLGLVLVLRDNALCGIVTDGDLRRAIEHGADTQATSAQGIMTVDPLTIRPDLSLYEAEALMHKHRVTALVVTDPAGHVLGVIQIHD